MSAGVFTKSKYELNNGGIGVIRIQPETEALTIGGTANAAPAGATTVVGRVKSRKNRREYGIGARTVTVEWTGTPPANYKADASLTIPVLQLAFWEAISELDTGTYLGAPIQVVSTNPENIK